MNCLPPVLDSPTRSRIESAVAECVQSAEGMLTSATAPSTRAVGDAIESTIADRFESILGDEMATFTSKLPRRAMADFEFTDNRGARFLVDVKTHRLGTAFNMPNLTSVKRLIDLYEESDVYFVVLMVKYEIEGSSLRVLEVVFSPIEWVDWDGLTIGSLGWGQIQIANSEDLTIDAHQTRRYWMLRLCDSLASFYPAEINKIHGRIEFAERARQQWAT